MAKYLSHAALVDRTAQLPTLCDAEPALAMVEFDSIAHGMLAADAMVKQSPVKLIHAGTVQPGRYLVLIGGPVAEVEEALKVGREVSSAKDVIWLPGVHRDVLVAIRAADRPPLRKLRSSTADALAIIETGTAPAAIHAADVAVKGAEIVLLNVRFSDGLGGKGIVLLVGQVSDVEAAVALVKGTIKAAVLLHTVVIPQLHDEMVRNVFGVTCFFR